MLFSVQVLGHEAGKVILFANATVSDPLPLFLCQPPHTLYSNLWPDLVPGTRGSSALPLPSHYPSLLPSVKLQPPTWQICITRLVFNRLIQILTSAWQLMNYCTCRDTTLWSYAPDTSLEPGSLQWLWQGKA